MHTKSIFMIFVLLSLLTACAVTSSPPTSISANPNTNSAGVTSLPQADTASSGLDLPTAPPPEVRQTPVNPVIVITAEPINPSPCLTPSSANQVVLDRSFEVLQALSKQDMTTLANYVHPLKGLRFSPYSYLRDTDLVFSTQDVASLPASSQVYSWGSNAGSDAPINLSFPDYYKGFIYDVDFANAPQVSLNHRLGGSTSTDNALEIYPDGKVVEFYYPGFDAKYEGMDWRSLRLVFTESNGIWYLIGIIHDQWTP